MTETSTYTHQELSARLAEVERERDELAAMVGRLRHIAKESQGWDWVSAWEAAEDAGEINLLVSHMQELVDAIDSIDEPAALAEIRATDERERRELARKVGRLDYAVYTATADYARGRPIAEIMRALKVAQLDEAMRGEQ